MLPMCFAHIGLQIILVYNVNSLVFKENVVLLTYSL